MLTKICRLNSPSSPKGFKKKPMRQRQLPPRWPSNKLSCSSNSLNNSSRSSKREWLLNRGFNKPKPKKACRLLNFNP